MSFLSLILHNVTARKLRAALTAGAIAIGVMAVLALGVLTTSLEQTATSILKVGNADFTIAQRHTDDILHSAISHQDIARVGQVPGVASVVGAYITTASYNAANPAVIEVGLDPSAQGPFGVQIVSGRSYAAHSPTEIMLGSSLVQGLGKDVGDTLKIGDKTRKVVGIYRTNISFGNATMMFPLTTLQGENQSAGFVTLGFVRVAPGTNANTVAKAVDKRFPRLNAIQTTAQYGESDRTLVLIKAANVGGTILAAVIAITGVLNTTLLSFFERIPEFGVLRSIGWSRFRVVGLVLGEVISVSVVGLGVGLLLGWGAVNALQQLGSLRGFFHPAYDASIFARSLYFAFGVAVVGALYPAVRAAFLSPQAALHRE